MFHHSGWDSIAAAVTGGNGRRPFSATFCVCSMLHTAQEGEKSREGALWGGVWGEVRGLRVATSPWRPSRRCHSANGQRPTTAARTALGRGVVRGRRKGRELGGAALPIGGSACSSLLALRPLVRSPAAEPMRTPLPSPSCQSPRLRPAPPGLGGGAFSTSESGRRPGLALPLPLPPRARAAAVSADR